MKPWIPLTALALALSPLLVVHPLRVSGHSMEPSLADGELRWALRAWASHAPRRGDLWVVEGPQGTSVKRVLGLPGDTVTWAGPDLWINGLRLDEPWVIHPERGGEGRQVCGEGYLVLGDNRPQSQDGRSWGAIPITSMRGRIL
ncbi:signal peptidase I [Geothrix limicola]|uniref:Signal peptidase I n=1 Tax=Geothrix limicola TaxID=2927978 RepID=A0ABQ5QDE4_9BACT|nr:signal peptidase I [Geothrix limicola]GLH72862.1 signal peptidase I [Geothrix limicola]